MDTNYFVCTLGQAALPCISRPFQNVNDLITKQAVDHPDLPAVGFYAPSHKHDAYQTRVFTFKQVLQGISTVASTIKDKVLIPECQTVGLLCNSSPAFLFTWLALIRLGHPVLLIAPQCSASAIVHLCKACNASILFHDEAHERLAQDTVGSSSELGHLDLKAHSLPYEHDDDVFKLVRKRSASVIEAFVVADTDVAYLHHTSGTSTGIPKPIPQTHRGGVAVLPALDGTTAATFTTTPLYHGGVADLFRAWASSAMIWLFPAQHAPITAINIVKCLNASSTVDQKDDLPAIRYFSSVPYVLQMMAQDKSGLQKLQEMHIVGVGGAALPPKVGDELVERKVNLVSRYGSAECGFLMSSHRDYDNDKGWQYLRRSEEVKELKFEQQDAGQSELVVLSGWPHMAKTNRDDGSFATSDLFAPHPSIPNAWTYHSRADSQLTLITGKKFDPAPIEGSLAASSALLSEVLIFGNGKPYPGAFLFRSEQAENESDETIIQQMAPFVEKLNRDSQSHARLPRNMLIPMPFEIAPLEKSSKGTILRGKAEEKYEQQIEFAYSKTSFAGDNVSDDELPSTIAKIIESVVRVSEFEQDPLTPETDLFAYGVDSVACVQIRHALAQLLPIDAESLPLTIVEDSVTISQLSKTILQLRKGESAVKDEDQTQLLHHLVEQYSSFREVHSLSRMEADHSTGYNVLLTGPTGLLGTHILSQLLSDPQVRKVYLLIRGATVQAAKERVTKALASRKLAVPPNFDDKVHVLSCKLSDPRLGLSDTDYELLVNEVDKILHLAWSVNFLISLRSLATTHLAGLQNLLNLALASKRHPQFLFCSSVASVSNLIGKREVPESVVDDYSACGRTGYAQSKLAAELICLKYATTTHMRDHITVIRIGQLSGDTNSGVWNMTEAYPLMLASSKATAVLPNLDKEVLGWLPVDIAAKCYIEAAFPHRNSGKSVAKNAREPVRVLHLLNTSRTTTFGDIARYIKDETDEIRIVKAAEWLDKLGSLQEDDSTKYDPSLKLLSFWRNVYGDHSNSSPPKGNSTTNGSEDLKNGIDDDGERQYQMELSKTIMPSLKDGTGSVDQDYVMKIWHWIESEAGNVKEVN